MDEARPLRDAPRPVTEVAAERLSALEHPEWRDHHPWLVQGMTRKGSDSQPFDLGLFSGGSDEQLVSEHWVRLASATGFGVVTHARQVHGAEVRVHSGHPVEGSATNPTPTPRLVDACDAHVTATPGHLLTVATADCVPVFAIDPSTRSVGVFHAGWRGVVAGVVENGIRTLVEVAMAATRGAEGEPAAEIRARLELHLGPAICGRCYEVGPEVFEGLAQPVPVGPTPIDLRAVIADRLVAVGVPAERITVSTHCTRCTDSGLFSHRGGDRGRQVGYIGVAGQPR